ncbi:hypothetical protein D3C81_825240 [compost metagenome]
MFRIVHAQLEHEAVQLGFRQRIGAFLLDRVLGGQHHERPRHRQGVALEGDLALLHHLEQRRLGLGRGAVDLVGEQQVGEHRAAAQLELLAGQVVDGVPGDVAGHQVGGELDACELAAEAARQGAHQQGLAEAGDALDQHVAAGEQGAEHVVDHRLLADQRLAQLLAHRLEQLRGALQLAGCVLGTGRGAGGGLFAVEGQAGFFAHHRAFLSRCRWAT